MRLSLGKTVVFLSTILSLALLTGCSLGTAEMEKTDIDMFCPKRAVRAGNRQKPRLWGNIRSL